MKARTTPGASVESKDRRRLLKIPAGDGTSYRFAQIDDYYRLARRNFPHHSVTLSLGARASSRSIPGTWGFGFWNDPFGMSPGFGGNRLQLPALPNTIWFFHASRENHLSFQDDKPAQGFIAQVFRSPRFHAGLIPAGLAFPIARKTTRNMLGKIITEDAEALRVDVTQWHRYRLEWRAEGSAFWVDDVLVFETSISPHPPLGLVIWIDNQYASFTPDGRIAGGLLPGGQEWLEIEDLEIKKDLD
jgi:hypothetical protein